MPPIAPTGKRQPRHSVALVSGPHHHTTAHNTAHRHRTSYPRPRANTRTPVCMPTCALPRPLQPCRWRRGRPPCASTQSRRRQPGRCAAARLCPTVCSPGGSVMDAHAHKNGQTTCSHTNLAWLLQLWGKTTCWAPGFSPALYGIYQRLHSAREGPWDRCAQATYIMHCGGSAQAHADTRACAQTEVVSVSTSKAGKR